MGKDASNKQQTGHHKIADWHKAIGQDVLGFAGSVWLNSATLQTKSGSKKKSGAQKSENKSQDLCGRIWICAGGFSRGKVAESLADDISSWQQRKIARSVEDVVPVETSSGPLYCVFVANEKETAAKSKHYGFLHKGSFASARDGAGASVNAIRRLAEIPKVIVDFYDCDRDAAVGAMVGLELAMYRYKDHMGGRVKAATKGPRKPAANAKGPYEKPQLIINCDDEELFEEALFLSVAVNFARHLINLPAGDLNPKTYSGAIKDLLHKQHAALTVDVWEWEKLKKEKLNLLMAVGQGAVEKPCLVHIRYRPKGARKGVQPLAFVGKGITFDTGGLDIKSADGMRLMKKDMGGSAALAALAWWVAAAEVPQPCDFYLCLAENSVSDEAFHPGDVIYTRSGKSVEIHNTDAEGRLVLADGLQVAVDAEGADAPGLVIDVATLTGAIKIALGLNVAGLFANDDKVADALLRMGQQYGDVSWRMPLFDPYFDQYKSDVASFANSAPGGWGGAITAALFLQQFVDGKPWAHFDIYSWAGSPSGPYGEQGGTGQSVALLAGFIRHWSKSKN